MSKYLFIIESPNKKKYITKALGSDYQVMASVGHIRDLPESKLSVDIKKNFQPTYEVYKDKKDVVNDIIKAAKKAEVVYLGMDGDREGEGIAWHISELLPPDTNCKRAKYGSVTPAAIKESVEKAGIIDSHLVDAYEARRILDRLVGYKCSYITKTATGGRSAGRTQSAGLRVLADRETEIRNFVPVVYWPVEAELLTDEKEKITAIIKNPDPLKISTKEEAEHICGVLKKENVKVSKFDKKNVSQKAYAPFTTSTMYQSGASILGWDSDRTARVAQKLYEAGAITYHRTDSVYIVPEFVRDIRSTIGADHDAKYLPSKANFYGNSKNAQEAHEACRVTDLSVRSYTSGSPEESKLYKMIWKRTVASQMAPTDSLRISIEFSCDDKEKSKTYTLSSSGSKLLFDGWRKVWDYGSVTDKIVPEVKVGEKLDVIDVKTERKETQPPPRFTKASFQKQLEKVGIGRPSTYASILKTLVDRGYVEAKKNIQVTDLGMKVNQFLVKSGFCFVDTSFTSQMEDKLDDVAQGKKGKVDVLDEFWKRLKSDIDNAKAIKASESKSNYKCPKCAKKKVEAFLLKKHSRYGAFYSCENYNNKDVKCDYKADVGENDEPKEKVKKEKVIFTGGDCPKCNSEMIVRKSKVGEFAGCSAYPRCDGKRDMDGNVLEFGKKKKKKWKKKSKKKN